MLDPSVCRARDIMSTNLVCVKEDTPIYEAIRSLVEGGLTGLPVVNGDMVNTGIISEKDMLRLLFNSEVLQGKIPDSARVENYMSIDILTVDHEDTLVSVCNCLIENHFRRVPVVAGGKLVGIITRADVIKYILKLLQR